MGYVSSQEGRSLSPSTFPGVQVDALCHAIESWLLWVSEPCLDRRDPIRQNSDRYISPLSCFHLTNLNEAKFGLSMLQNEVSKRAEGTMMVNTTLPRWETMVAVL